MNASTRYLELDALRGFAVMGILAMNILAFAMPEMAYVNPTVYGGAEGSNLIAWLIGFILFDGKMRGLFSLLFGASMMLVINRAEAKSESPGTIHYARMVTLALFGLFHYFFIWWGDILFLYAVIGCCAYGFRNWDVSRLIKWAVIIYLAGILMMSAGLGSIFFLQAEATATDASAAAIAEYEVILSEFGNDPAVIAREVALHSGSYWNIVSTKFAERWFQPFANPFTMAFETLPLMMLGMAGLKNGFLLGDSTPATYRKWAIWGIGCGAILYVLLGWITIQSDFDVLITINANMAWSIGPRLLMTMGYAAALILLIQKFAGSRFLTRVACAGRAAFTNYLGASLIMTTIFYGYGFGLFGEVDRAGVYVFVVTTWALMLIWSKPWLTRFRYGPLEWLWRSLARRELQAMRIR